MKRILLSMFIISIIILNACFEQDGIITPEYSISKKDSIFVDLDYRQKVLINNKLEIYFEDIAGDSRCPLNVMCVWEGDGAVVLNIRIKGLELKTTLHTTLQPQHVSVDEYVIKLISLNPYPVYGKEIKKEDYKVELLIYFR